ncbi:hypothetical protein [Nocardioides panzhihuensis]|uniref:Uncharacterized protein n=1 Tax=Nocardioides panzhihuensis TaxID=860243 RepID=A0A7Z0DQY1_9ACTN|nr:hypothetical protein [Nocardioides panzhihuensis]NYI79711.1 hypothetical protein [Nocardioides panzhihuensis]
MADMPTWLIIVLAVIFLTPVLGPILIVLISFMIDLDGEHERRKRTDDGKHIHERGGCGGDGGSCGGGD